MKQKKKKKKQMDPPYGKSTSKGLSPFFPPIRFIYYYGEVASKVETWNLPSGSIEPEFNIL